MTIHCTLKKCVAHFLYRLDSYLCNSKDNILRKETNGKRIFSTHMLIALLEAEKFQHLMEVEVRHQTHLKLLSHSPVQPTC